MWRSGRSPPEPYPPHEEEYFQYYQTNGGLFHLHRRIYTPLNDIKHPGDWGELYFRDYLHKHPDVAGEYESLKLALREQFEHDWDA